MSTTVVTHTENQVRARSLGVAMAEIASALSDLAFASVVPGDSASKIGSAVQSIEKAVSRIEGAVLQQPVTHRAKMLAALATAEGQFLTYEKLHREKGTEDGAVKAETNKTMAAMCAKARENKE